MIYLRVLGTLDVRDDAGTELQQLVVQPKLIALLTFLALAKPNGYHRRDKIIALFWPELDQEHARAALRAAMHRIRQAIGAELILRRGNEEIALDRAAIWCDAHACESALDDGDVLRVVDWYRGDLLDGFYIPDAAPEFEQWLDETRVRLRARMVAAAKSAATALPSDAAVALLTHARGIVADDEDTVRRLMTALHKRGERAAALRTYDEFARSMAESYAAEPSAETQQLAALLRRTSEISAPATTMPVDSPAASAGPAPPVATYVLRRPVTVVLVLVVIVVALGGWWITRGDMRADVVAPPPAARARAAWNATSGDHFQALTHHSVVIHPRRDRLYVYGGSSSALIRDEVWRIELNRSGITNWDRVPTQGSQPAPRWGHQAVLDTVSNRMIVTGGALGHSSPCSGDVWLLIDPDGWDATPKWQKLNAKGALPPRANHSAVYDASTNRLIVFGGHDCFVPRFSDVWVLTHANGLGGHPEWRKLDVSGGPGARTNHTAVFDTRAGRMIVYGGTDKDASYFPEVWTLENANGIGTPRWTTHHVDGERPVARYGHVSAFDDATGSMIVFGGAHGAQVLNDVWLLRNSGASGKSTWTRLPVAGRLPPARATHAGAYDASDNRLIVIGGSPPISAVFADLWLLSQANGN